MKITDLPPHLRLQAERQLAQTHVAVGEGHTSTSSNPPACVPYSPPLDYPPDSACTSPAHQTPDFSPLKLPTYPTAVYSAEISADRANLRFIFDTDPSTLRTAQHKGNKPYIGRDGKAHVHYFTKKAVSDSYAPIRDALPFFRSHTLSWGAKDPLIVEIVFFYPYPKSTPKKRQIDGAYRTETPDVDNLEKEMGDAISKSHLWRDDAAVADLHIVKLYTTNAPRIAISVTNAAMRPPCPTSLFVKNLLSIVPPSSSVKMPRSPQRKKFASWNATSVN